MNPFLPKSTVAQLAEHLREQVRNGQIGDELPGVNRLVRQLGVGTQTVISAVAALEKEGLLVRQGGRRSRKVMRDAAGARQRSLKVEILLYEQCDSREGFLVELRYRLQQAGHTAVLSSKSLMDLGMDPARVARHVAKARADAWVVFVGSRPVLEWFASQPFPAFALLGRGRNVDIAGLTVSKMESMNGILRRLVEHGHRRIVLMTRDERRKPHPGALEQNYLSQLAALGLPTGTYNLPDWDNNPRSFHIRLASLFARSQPTAMLFDEPMLYFGALQFFAKQRLRIPEDVSAVVLDSHPAFAWADPAVTHLDTNPPEWVHKVMSWMSRVAKGKDNRRKTVVKAEIVDGGTIAKARIW